MILWDGACHVHEEFSLEGILELRRRHPGAQIVAHPSGKIRTAAGARNARRPGSGDEIRMGIEFFAARAWPRCTPDR